MIVIASVTLPSSVLVGASFLIQVSVLEIPDDFIRYCGTFYSGQDYAF